MQLKELIKQEIVTGKLPAGSRILPTVALAEKYGVCHKTAQLALRALASEGLVNRRKHYGTTVADLNTSDLQEAQNGGTVALMMPYLPPTYTYDAFTSEIIDGVMLAARDYACDVNFYMYSNLQSLKIDNSTKGFLLLRPCREDALRIKNIGMPTVLLDIVHRRIGLGYVASDNVYGINLAVKHLHELGHRKILYVHSDCEPENNFSGQERYRGFHIAVKKYNLQDSASSIIRDDLSARIRSTEFTAMIADGHDSTLACLGFLKENDCRIPDDISFVGFDDIESNQYRGITVIKQNLGAVGKEAIDLLLSQDMAWRTEKTLVKPEIIIRNSTKNI